MSLFEKSRRRANRLTKINIDEVSLVDAGANAKSNLILKRRDGAEMAISFQPILFAKADSDEEDEELDDEDDDETDDEVPPTRKVKKMVERYLQKRFSAEHTGDNETGADARNADERSKDADNVREACLQSPPVASERFEDWAKRVFKNQLGNLDGAEMAIARKLFAAAQHATAVQKSASDALDTIAKRRAEADPSKSYFQHWRDLVTESPSLYAIHKGAQDVPADAFNADHHWNGDEARSLYTPTNDSGGDQGDDGADALDTLNKSADEIRKRGNGKLTKAQSFTKACADDPTTYEKYRRATR